MIGEIAQAVEMGADIVGIGKTIHSHPALGESIGMAAEVTHGSCTDVPPARKVSTAIKRYRLLNKKGSLRAAFVRS